ncbi:methyltransferase type 11 [cyanobacterium TDX16]|nr:methyltransferase type 11 [cyanobacterium TDX16]
MSDRIEEVREFWNSVADDWDIQVGDDGDSNRRLNSDPVLWNFVGDVRDLRILGAGCGTGYLSRKLASQGALVTAVDLSDKMIEIAREKANNSGQNIDFHVDNCETMDSLEDNFFDAIVSNYVLMDVPNLENATRAFNRVLKVNGNAIVVFSHPCFPQGRAIVVEGCELLYRWSFSYFERKKCVDPPWKHFTSNFIWFHRPLSDYWKAFRNAGFEITDFEEPRITEQQFHLAETEQQIKNCQTRPYSVAFKLKKV